MFSFFKRWNERYVKASNNFIDEIITYFNNGNNDNSYRIAILSLPRLIEHWWDGIGDWMAKVKPESIT